MTRKTITRRIVILATLLSLILLLFSGCSAADENLIAETDGNTVSIYSFYDSPTSVTVTIVISKLSLLNKFDKEVEKEFSLEPGKTELKIEDFIDDVSIVSEETKIVSVSIKEQYPPSSPVLIILIIAILLFLVAIVLLIPFPG